MKSSKALSLIVMLIIGISSGWILASIQKNQDIEERNQDLIEKQGMIDDLQLEKNSLLQITEELELQNQWLEFQRMASEEQFDEWLETYVTREDYDELLAQYLILNEMYRVLYAESHNGSVLWEELGFLDLWVEPRKPVFPIGDIVTLDIESKIPLIGSFFTVSDPNGTRVWVSDPLDEWVIYQDYWVVWAYSQSFDGDPFVLFEDFPQGNWTWVFSFDEVDLVDGWFWVDEEYDGIIDIGVSNLNNSLSGVKEVSLNSSGISLLLEPSIEFPRDRDYVDFTLVIVNDNAYPVKIPIFSTVFMGHELDEMMPSMKLSCLEPHFLIDAESSWTLNLRGYLVRYPEFSLFVSVEGVSASFEVEIEP